VEPASGRGLQAVFWGDCENAEIHIKNLQAAVWRRPCLYNVVAGRRVVGDAELNPPSKPEYVLLDKYICNKEVAHIRAR
jgi:hypothetical protein